jgi:hypothetical protein
MRAHRPIQLALLSLPLLLAPATALSAQSFTPNATAPATTTLARQTDGTFTAAQRARRAAHHAEDALLTTVPAHLTSAPAVADEGFEASGFAQFMSSKAGRLLRVVAGAGMIAGGIAADTDLGTGIAIAGAVPLLAGTFDFCVLSPLFGGPLSGKAIRAAGN